MATIDLGELTPTGAAPPPPPRWTPSLRRGLAVVVVAAALLLGSVGAAPGRPALGSPLWTDVVSLIGFRMSENTIFVTQPGERVVEARDVATGDLRWRYNAADAASWITEISDGLVAIQIHENGRDPFSGLAFIEESSGRVLATTKGSVAGRPVGSSDVLVVSPWPQCPDYDRPCFDVTLVRPRTGEVLYRLPGPVDGGLTLSSVDLQVEAFATYERDGAVRIHDPRTGAVIDQGTIVSGLTSGVLLRPDLLVTVRDHDGGATVEAYHRPGLSPAWSTSVPASDPDDLNQWYGTADCGEWLCVTVGGQQMVIDPATGRTLFSYQGLIVGQLGSGVLVGRRLSPTERFVDNAYPLDLLDPDTGAVLVTVPDAWAIEWVDGGDRVLIGQQGPERTAFFVGDAAGRLRPLGSVTGTGLQCAARRHHLVCGNVAGSARVWRLPDL